MIHFFNDFNGIYFRRSLFKTILSKDRFRSRADIHYYLTPHGACNSLLIAIRPQRIIVHGQIGDIIVTQIFGNGRPNLDKGPFSKIPDDRSTRITGIERHYNCIRYIAMLPDAIFDLARFDPISVYFDLGVFTVPEFQHSVIFPAPHIPGPVNAASLPEKII